MLKDKKSYNSYMRNYMLRRYHERRLKAFLFLGSICAFCGTRENLEIDHIDWRTKSFSISKLWSVSLRRFEQELEKCQLLCFDCHKAKTRIDMRNIKLERG